MTIPNFKDFLASDMTTFINPDEFATLHTIDDRELWVVVDTDRRGRHLPSSQNMQPPSYTEGVSVWQQTIYVDFEELGYLPEENQIMMFDGKRVQVAGVANDDGMLMIILEANEG